MGALPPLVILVLAALIAALFLLGMAFKIVSRREAHSKASRLHLLDGKILDSSPIALVLMDREMRALRVSKAYKKITGFDPEKVLGRTILEFMPEGMARDGILSRMRRVRDTGETSGPVELVSPLERQLRETIVPVFGEDGTVVQTLTLLEDLGERRRLERRVRYSEERYRVLFNSIQDGIILHESPKDAPPGLIIEANESLNRMSGYSIEELRTMRPTDLGGRPTPEQMNSTGRELMEGRVAMFERTILTKDGRRIPVENRAIRFELDGRPVVLAVLRDITERKAAQARLETSLREKEVLLREVHHRVKNNLHVIAGLLNLQARFIRDSGAREVFKESENRIKSMAIVHEALYGTDNLLTSIDFAQYVRVLVTNMESSYGIRDGQVSFRLEMEPTPMVLDTAIPCCLIVNELLSNAIKHAFPGGRRGEVTVKLAKTAAGRFVLAVRDDGVGLPEGFDPRSAETLGLKLVTLLVEQLGSRLEMIPCRGACFSFEFSEYREAGSG